MQIWGASEYLQQQDGVRLTQNKRDVTTEVCGAD